MVLGVLGLLAESPSHHVQVTINIPIIGEVALIYKYMNSIFIS